jgi:hypothetical protein
MSSAAYELGMCNQPLSAAPPPRQIRFIRFALKTLVSSMDKQVTDVSSAGEENFGLREA